MIPTAGANEKSPGARPGLLREGFRGAAGGCKVAPVFPSLSDAPFLESVLRASTPAFRLAPIALAAALLAGCNAEKAAAPAPAEARPVRTMVVNSKPYDDGRTLPGEIRPRIEADVGFRVAGKIAAREVGVGARVTAGQELARLDEQDLRNRLTAAEADVSAAEAGLTQARDTEGRQRQLLQSGTTTKARFDDAVAALRGAEAKEQSAQAALRLARDQLAYATLKADWDGIVTAVGAEAGQVVGAGQMVLRIARPGEKDAVFSVAEEQLRHPPSSPTIEVRLRGDAAVATTGRVREIAPVADAQTRTTLVKVAIEDPQDRFRLGALVVGQANWAVEPRMTTPLSAIFQKDRKPAVWVVDRATSTVHLQPVEILRYEPERAVLAGGLGEGDLVVTAGVNRLQEGQKVRIDGAGK